MPWVAAAIAAKKAISGSKGIDIMNKTIQDAKITSDENASSIMSQDNVQQQNVQVAPQIQQQSSIDKLNQIQSLSNNTNTSTSDKTTTAWDRTKNFITEHIKEKYNAQAGKLRSINNADNKDVLVESYKQFTNN